MPVWFARVVHTPRLALPVRATWSGPKPTHSCGMLVWAHTLAWPRCPIWPSPCGPYCHTHTITRLCLTHSHALVKHTFVSRRQPATQLGTCSCGFDSMLFLLSPKFNFLRFGNTPVTISMQKHSRATQHL
ncbi:hypothetical protein PVK06_005123 [Gossypium arboreum]|uniref:Secreted protein n=1 Tax=Gossypium arboreum TaxID=29729 RepID=A0ABR0QU04_GOSAR|nr:hypothetical protein PVK06_005123 [Gossypium arboreum]